MNLKLSPEERLASGRSDSELLLRWDVHNAMRRRFDPLEYDVTRASMLRLPEYVGVDTVAVDTLVEADLHRDDTDHPHRLYSILPEGRKLIEDGYREGADYHHGKGDFEESSVHVLGVELGHQLVESASLADPNSMDNKLVPYYGVDDQQRPDLAGLDADGTSSPSRSSGSTTTTDAPSRRTTTRWPRASPRKPSGSPPRGRPPTRWSPRWLTPPDGEPRVSKTYAKTTAPQDFRIDEPGMTAIYTFEYVRDTLLAE